MTGLAKKPDALQGTLDLLVLRILSRGPEHGYGIAARVEGYPALHRMEQTGWIDAEWQVTENRRRARVYRITRAGQQHLDREIERWNALSKAVGKILRFA
jgi:transcriptional regulator